MSDADANGAVSGGGSFGNRRMSSMSRRELAPCLFDPLTVRDFAALLVNIIEKSANFRNCVFWPAVLFRLWISLQIGDDIGDVRVFLQTRKCHLALGDHCLRIVQICRKIGVVPDQSA